MESSEDKSIHMVSELPIARNVERYERIDNKNKKTTLTPISAGTTATDLEAKYTSLLRAIKTNVITIVDGIVPIMPPIFVPYRSASIVIKVAIVAERVNGMITRKTRLFIGILG